jgi:chitinase
MRQALDFILYQVQSNVVQLFRCSFLPLLGVKAVLQSLNKRDNSHWELFDCNNSIGEQRQTVKAVCTDDSENSNCGDIFIDGAPETIIEMPGNCGPGKYAVVVSMEVSTDHMHLENRLFRRGLGGAAVYDLTFDYDFTPIQKRDDSSVLLRIDYSDDPGYWASIVAAQPGTKHKRDIDIEVEQQYGGDHKAWLADQWHIDKRSLPLEELHKRWWSGDLREWLDRQKQVDITYTGIRHSIQVPNSFFKTNNSMLINY